MVRPGGALPPDDAGNEFARPARHKLKNLVPARPPSAFSAGALPETFFGNSAITVLNFSVTLSPPQATLSPGDVIQVDFLAPAGLQFVFTEPSGAFDAPVFDFIVGNTSGVSNGHGRPAIGIRDGTGWKRNHHWRRSARLQRWRCRMVRDSLFSVTGTVSFTELSAQRRAGGPERVAYSAGNGTCLRLRVRRDRPRFVSQPGGHP